MASLQSKDASTEPEIDIKNKIQNADHVQELEKSIAEKQAELERKSSTFRRTIDILKYPFGVAAGTGGIMFTAFIVALVIGTAAAGAASFGIVPAVVGSIAIVLTASAAYYGVYKNKNEIDKVRKDLKDLKDELSLATDPVKAKSIEQAKQRAAELEAKKLENEAKELETRKIEAEALKAQAEAEANKGLKTLVGKHNGPDFSESKFRNKDANLDAYVISTQRSWH